MLHRSYDGLHRTSKNATARPSRLVAGLALPTIAAAVLTFTAAGSAVATSTKTQAVTPSHNTTASHSATRVSAPVATAVDHDEVSDRRVQAARASALGIVRADVAAQASRSATRKKLAARTLEAQRAAHAHSWRLPISSYMLTSGFGWRWGRLHAGEDFAAPVGTDLVSMSTGTVTFAGEESGYGNMVKIRYWDGTVTYYGHMSRTSVTEGEEIEPGQVVGQSGNTGHSTGPHLHLEVHPDGGAPVNPLPWLASHNIAP